MCPSRCKRIDFGRVVGVLLHFVEGVTREQFETDQVYTFLASQNRTRIYLINHSADLAQSRYSHNIYHKSATTIHSHAFNGAPIPSIRTRGIDEKEKS